MIEEAPSSADPRSHRLGSLGRPPGVGPGPTRPQPDQVEAAARVGTWEWDTAADEVRWSPELRRIYGVSADEAPTDYDGFLRRVHPADLEKTRTQVEAAFETATPRRYVHRIVRPDGQVRTVRSQINVDTDETGAVRCMYGTCQDVTNEAELADRLQTRSSSPPENLEVVHDSNNLLGVILSSCDLLLQTELPERSRGLVREIQSAAERSAELLGQRLRDARRRSRPPKLDPSEVISGLSETIRRMLPASVELRLALVPGVGPVRARRSEIERLVMNLVKNAVQAMPDGGVLTLATELTMVQRTASQDSYACIRVSDTGIGMDDVARARAFEPFYSDSENGTGIGLSSVQSVARELGGFVHLQSEPGRGTTFQVHLPRTLRR